MTSVSKVITDNCRHQLVPVADAVVPAHLRAKFAKPTTPEPAPEPAKPQPIDTKPYQEAMSKVLQYTIDHPRSAKIKGYLNGIMKAVKDNDEKQLQELLKQAKADIAKFEAAAKAIAKKKANVTTTPAPTSAVSTTRTTKTSTQQSVQPVQTNTHKPVIPLKKEYKSTADVWSTMKKIDTQTQWFNPNNLSGGAGNLEVETNPKKMVLHQEKQVLYGLQKTVWMG